jgi:hypothetical protein
MKLKTKLSSPELSRRAFLGKAVKGATLTALFAGLPKGWVGTAYASDAPETSALNFGMIALTDCSPIVIAHEKGLFKKYGIESIVRKVRTGRRFATIFPAARFRQRTCSSACRSPRRWASPVRRKNR